MTPVGHPKAQDVLARLVEGATYDLPEPAAKAEAWRRLSVTIATGGGGRGGAHSRRLARIGLATIVTVVIALGVGSQPNPGSPVSETLVVDIEGAFPQVAGARVRIVPWTQHVSSVAPVARELPAAPEPAAAKLQRGRGRGRPSQTPAIVQPVCGVLEEADFARRALAAADRTDYAQVLSIVADYERACPQRELEAEVMSLRVGALCALGRPAARDARDRYQRRWPDSVGGTRVARMCDDG